MSLFKKIFIISTTLLVAALFFLGIYNLSFKKSSAIKDETATDGTVDPLFDFSKKKDATVADKKIQAITDEAIISPVLKSEGDYIMYYAKGNGNVLRVTPDGKEKKIVSSDTLSGLVDNAWSPKQDKVISQFRQGAYDTFSMYDFNTQKVKNFDPGMDNIVWSNMGDKIIYKYYDGKTKKWTLNVSDPDSSNWKELTELAYRNMKITQIPRSTMLSFWNMANSFEETNFSVVSMLGGEKKTIFSNKFGADYLWSPNGEKVLVSSVENKGGSRMNLSVMNSQAGEYVSLGTPTMVSKCIWSKDSSTVYCAFPGSIPDNAVMPNDYQEGKIQTKDSFWKINVAAGGKKDRIIEIEDLNAIGVSFDAKNLFLSSEEDALFFVNSYDGKLYRINL